MSLGATDMRWQRFSAEDGAMWKFTASLFYLLSSSKDVVKKPVVTFDYLFGEHKKISSKLFEQLYGLYSYLSKCVQARQTQEIFLLGQKNNEPNDIF